MNKLQIRGPKLSSNYSYLTLIDSFDFEVDFSKLIQTYLEVCAFEASQLFLCSFCIRNIDKVNYLKLLFIKEIQRFSISNNHQKMLNTLCIKDVCKLNLALIGGLQVKAKL